MHKDFHRQVCLFLWINLMGMTASLWRRGEQGRFDRSLWQLFAAGWLPFTANGPNRTTVSALANRNRERFRMVNVLTGS
jgi:hypothetical protein